MSYGRLSNSHLIQKYGFTMADNPYNQLSVTAPYHDYQAIVSEEAKLKQQVRSRLSFPNTSSRMLFSLFKGRFNADTIRQTRLNLLTSKSIMEFLPDQGDLTSTQHFLERETFKEPLDPENEQMSFEYLISTLEGYLSHLKPREHYLSSAGNLESSLDSLDKFHQLNIARLHLDEVDILKGNLEYLVKAKDTNIRSFYERGGK